MRALIVDDERLARKELMKLLEDHPMIEVVGEAMNAEEATQMVNELNPDLLFLDIQMPGKTGFQTRHKNRKPISYRYRNLLKPPALEFSGCFFSGFPA